MKILQGRRALLLDAALIILVNAVILAGVAYNRTGEPESTLTLSGREMHRPNDPGEGGSSSFILNWKTDDGDFYYSPDSRDTDDETDQRAPWISEAGLAALGFRIVQPDARSYRSIARMGRREALVVLEMDGPAYQRALAAMRHRAGKALARAGAAPADTELKQRAAAMEAMLAGMENEESRLYVVDAGLDRQTLRHKYPDNRRYAIVRAEIRPVLRTGRTATGRPVLSASVRLQVERIEVPKAQRQALLREHGAIGNKTGIKMELAFGQRLEPWLVSLAPSRAD